MSVPLLLDQRTVGDVVVLQLHGHLVVDEGDRALLERVTWLVGHGTTSILIDLADVSYIDSGGAGALVRMLMQVTSRGGQLKLVHPSRCSSRVLRITHLTSVFEIFEDEDEAVRSMSH